MLGVVQTFGEDLPEACQNTCMEAWIVFDNLLIKYGAEYNVADRACRVIRLGLQFFSVAALPTVPAVLSRMTAAFQSSGHSSYIWIVGKAVGYFGRQEPAAFRDLFKTSYEQISTSLFQTLQTQSPRSIPDGKSARRLHALGKRLTTAL